MKLNTPKFRDSQIFIAHSNEFTHFRETDKKKVVLKLSALK